MYSIFDEADVLPDIGGTVENNAAEKQIFLNSEQRSLERQQQQEQQHDSDYDNFTPNSYRTDMVAQVMSQGVYGQLVQSAQEPEEFIALEELRPRLQRDKYDETPISDASLYQQQDLQSYYSLSSMQESSCPTVYFTGISSGSGLEDLLGTVGGGEGVASPTLTPTLAQANQIASTKEANSSSNTSTAVSEPTQQMEGSKMVSENRSMSTYHCHHTRSHHHHHHHHHDHRRNSHDSSRSVCKSEELTPDAKKRKITCQDGSDMMTDDTGDDEKSVRSGDDSKKQNHSEIEKRRRDKMNTYITELSSMVPMCHAMSRKLDKLTVLRMAVQHLKTILGAVTSYTEGHYKPAFLSDQELKTLILQVAEGFVFVVGCDRGRILYVSKSVSQTLNYSQGDLLGQNWFDILHPKDVAKVKEQLSSSDLSPRERLIDAKTMLPVKTDIPHDVSRLCPGSRRSFFCRMKRKVSGASCGDSQIKEESETRRKKHQNLDWKYCVIQCTGYLKSWAPAKTGLEEQEGEADGEACNLSCLVAVGRLQPAMPTPSLISGKPQLRSIEFVSRHAMDGKFLFVDQRATLVLDFLPQELMGTSMYEYYHHDDISHLAESHKAALQSSERVTTQVYRFRSKGGTFVRLQSEWKSFRNPWTKDIEYLIAKNILVNIYDARKVEPSSNSKFEGSSVQGNYDYFTQSNSGLDKLISSHVEVSKIGRQIAEEVLDLQRRGDDSSSSYSPGPGPEPAMLSSETQLPSIVTLDADSTIQNDPSNNRTASYRHIKRTSQLSSIANDQGQADENVIEMIDSNVINNTQNQAPTDGNDEAAMAVIMSLLEADAGLGGPVDFSGLPWPLP